MLTRCRSAIRRTSGLNSQRHSNVFKKFSAAADEIPADSKKSLYFWGTNQGGSLPSKDVLSSGRDDATTNSAAERILSKARKDTIVDHPLEIDLEDAFGKLFPCTSSFVNEARLWISLLLSMDIGTYKLT